MIPTYYSENKETYYCKETNENNHNKKYLQTEEMKYEIKECEESVPEEGKANNILYNYINSSRLVYDKGNVKPEDRKEFGIKIPCFDEKKRNSYQTKGIYPKSEALPRPKFEGPLHDEEENIENDPLAKATPVNNKRETFKDIRIKVCSLDISERLINKPDMNNDINKEENISKQLKENEVQPPLNEESPQRKVEAMHKQEFEVTMKQLPKLKEIEEGCSQKDESPQGNSCIKEVDEEEEEKKDNICSNNMKASILNAMKNQNQFRPNFVVDDSSNSDSESKNAKNQENVEENVEENKKKTEEDLQFLQTNKRQKPELKHNNSDKTANVHMLGVPPAVKAPLHNKKKLGERKFQCKSLSETFDLRSLKKFDSKEILRDLSKNHLLQNVPLNLNNP